MAFSKLFWRESLGGGVAHSLLSDCPLLIWSLRAAACGRGGRCYSDINETAENLWGQTVKTDGLWLVLWGADRCNVVAGGKRIERPFHHGHAGFVRVIKHRQVGLAVGIEKCIGSVPGAVAAVCSR